MFVADPRLADFWLAVRNTIWFFGLARLLNFFRLLKCLCNQWQIEMEQA